MDPQRHNCGLCWRFEFWVCGIPTSPPKLLPKGAPAYGLLDKLFSLTYDFGTRVPEKQVVQMYFSRPATNGIQA